MSKAGTCELLQCPQPGAVHHTKLGEQPLTTQHKYNVQCVGRPRQRLAQEMGSTKHRAEELLKAWPCEAQVGEAQCQLRLCALAVGAQEYHDLAR